MIDWDSVVLAPVHGVFEEEVIYQPFDGEEIPARGVYDESYSSLNLAGASGISSSNPVLGIRLSTFPVIPQQDDFVTITRTGERFVIKNVEPDGHGEAKLMLNMVSDE